MAGKPELSASTGVQNVVVYVSDGNFAQAYAVGQQNVAPFNSQASHHGTMAYTNTPQSLATMVGPTAKAFSNKPSNYPLNGASGYFTTNPQTVISHNGFPQPCNTANVLNGFTTGYQNIIHNDTVLNQSTFKNLVNYGGINTEVLSGQRQAGPGRPDTKLLRDDCDNNREGYSSADSGYVSVVGGDASSQSVRCDSVRSETAESSCSSLSSTDEGLVFVHPQGSEMVVYDGSVSVRPGGVVLTVGPPGSPQPQTPAIPLMRTVSGPQTPSVSVPFGWKRLVDNGFVVYISPNNTALSTLDQVKEYLLTPGTCKCGLECPLKYDAVFNFDPKVIGKPWTFPPDTNTRDLTKLCNHKRKIFEMASVGCKPLDQTIIKDCNTKRKKKKTGSPYSGASVSQILAHRERLSLTHPVLCKEGLPNSQYSNQIWPSGMQHPISRCYTEPAQNPTTSVSNSVQYFRYQNQDASVNRVIMDQQHTVDSTNISQHNIANYHNMHGYGQQNLQVPVHQQHIIGPNGQIIGFQSPINPNIIPQQQKVFINSPPIESNAPGRPNVQMVPIIPASQPKPERTFYNPSFQYQQGVMPQQYDASRSIRPPFIPRDHQFSTIIQQQNSQNAPASPVVIHQQRSNWQPNRLQNNNLDERVPPLFQHTPPVTVWTDDNTRKKNKTNKMVKKRPFNIYENQIVNTPCPNVDVRQIPTMNQSPQITQGSSSPSFMEDPSGYLAQQTALLNSTFSKQTGSYIYNLPGSESNEVPLPSNIPVMQAKQNFNRNNQNIKDVQQHYNQSNMAKGPADSTGISMEHMHCQGCIDITQYQDGRFPSRPNSQPNSLEDPVTSSTYLDRQASPDSRPIQGGTISTSNGSPNSTPTTPQPRPPSELPTSSHHSYPRVNTSMLGVVTTMASGRTVGSNTITSVLAGRANTSTVSVNTPVTIPFSTISSLLPTQAITVNVSRSPLEMVQSVVSSIQVPQQQSSLQIIKHSPPGHILVSSGGQLIMPPPPPKLITNQNTMPPISVSPMVTNVTAAVTQVIPAVAQQVLGQQTVLVNALPTPFVIQPGVAVAMDGINQNIQLPQLVTGNVIQQVDPNDARVLGRTTALLSPDTKKKGKKRKMASQTIASMLQIAATQQNSGIVMSQPSFSQQVQMAHSPQGIAATPVMQALTIVPGKPGAPPQIVMNSQGVGNSGQFNLLQPVNLINGPTGMVQNFPTIQQFIVPNLGSMVMNADGTATILQDTSNLGMQLQLQNVNGQNVLTPVQNNVFNSGQSILTAAPTGMVIRSPGTTHGKIIQQQHSPGAQFLSPNGNQFVVNGAQFSGQLSPLVANVSPTQMTFSAAPQALRSNGPPQPTHQDFIHCGQMGQTLMVPAGNITVSSANQQNTTYVQQNTTIVQQQTTMVANNTQNNQNCATVNVEQNFNRPLQAVIVQQSSPACRHSVSTQTAINQNTQAVTTNTFCQTSSAGSPPDTTTHSPLALEGADTTTHSGSTDDGLSPAPSNCSDIVTRQQSCSMAMVHCISSSEPDSADLNLQCSESDWITDIKKSMGYSTESTTVLPGIQFITEQIKQQEAVVSSRNFDKINRRKHGDTLVVMENRHSHLSLFEDNDENITKQDSTYTSSFVRGDLVWGPAKGYPAWPGKLLDVQKDVVLVKWFGGEKIPTKIDPCLLQTLTEGLEAHHRARKNCRKSRKLDNQLENAIQEAMAELDKTSEIKNQKQETATKPNFHKKLAGRLRSSQK